MKSPIVLLESLCHDCQRLNPDVEGLKRDIQTLKKRYEHEGYGFLTVALPAFGAALQQGLSSGKFACPTGLVKIRGGAIPRLFSGMLCKVFDTSTGVLMEDADLGIIKCLYEILMLHKKTQLSPENEEFLHRKAVDEFYQCDEAARQVVIPDRHAHHIGRVAKLILNTLKSKDVENATYRHGPGGVEEGLRANQKWQALSNALRIGAFDASDYGFEVQTYDHLRSHRGKPCGAVHEPTLFGNRLPDRRHVREDHECGHRSATPRGVPLFVEAPRRRAKLVTVAKNSTSRRTITVEPLVNQFVQQGLNILLRESISECRILRNCLALTDQGLNQKLALEGSLHDNWATIDLKSASDLLSTKLVGQVFEHQGLFFDHMMDCRSSQVYSDCKEAIELGKFAGMGNALTFPVQSVCFAVVSIAAILDVWGLSPDYRNCLRASRCIRVYGDDIIVRREYARQCVNWLQDVGLKVNIKKSFLEGNFKESCGVDAFKGVDITPLYLRYRPDDGSTNPSNIASLVATSNAMWQRGLYEASACLKDEVEGRLGKRLPLVSSSSGLLGWHSRIDSSSAHKWCKRTHQLLVRAMSLTSLKRKDIIDGYAALLKYFCTAKSYTEDQRGFATTLDYIFPLSGLDMDHLRSTPIRFKSRIRSSWVPVRVA